jgi:hypothetical protein
LQKISLNTLKDGISVGILRNLTELGKGGCKMVNITTYFIFGGLSG